jgi:hypothetical protein
MLFNKRKATKTEDTRFSDIIELLGSSYTTDELKHLAGSILGWGPSEVKYEDHKAIMEILSDIVLGNESSFQIMLGKPLAELPLYLINGATNDRKIAKWRLRCGR